MTDTRPETAQVFKGIHDIPTYTDILGRRPLRLWVAAPLMLGVPLTCVAAVLALQTGHARAILIGGLLATAALAGIGALIPATRPGLPFRLAAALRALRPTPTQTHRSPLATPPDMIGHLRFTPGGVYADYLISGLRSYLEPIRNRRLVADKHKILARELPSGVCLYGLSVPQDQRQILLAMLDGHEDSVEWVESCRQLAGTLAVNDPRRRIFWLSFPVDGGRAGHSPAGQATKIRDWAAGRDKDADTSIAAYRRLADDVIASLPAEFTPHPVTPQLARWFWSHNLFSGAAHTPLPPSGGPERLAADQFTHATLDEGNQRGRRPLPAWLAWIPSWKPVLRITSEDGHTDNYQTIVAVTDMPKGGIIFPGSEFLDSLDDLDTSDQHRPSAVFDWAIQLTKRPREYEFTRNDRAKGNVYDQFDQRHDLRDGDAQLSTTLHQLAEYHRLLSDNADEQPVEAAFFIRVAAGEEEQLEYSVKRLKEALTGAGQIVMRRYRGAQARMWSAFNPGVTAHRSGIDQFGFATTTAKWSRFSPITTVGLGNAIGMLLGFCKANANNGAVLLDLSGAARRNHNPILLVAGAPGYGKSYAAKRIVRAELLRGSRGFIVDPGVEWARAFHGWPNSATIDMAGGKFGCDPLRIFPADLAGGYWLDYMAPMLGLDPRSIGVARLRTLLGAQARQRLGIAHTASLIDYLASIQAPATGTDLRPAAVVELANDTREILFTLQSWATHDFTRGIFDPTLPIPDLSNLDLTVWLTGSLDLPTAEEMATPHLYQALSERKKASVAIYAMIVRLARLAFFAEPDRFGLIVLEEAGALLNSRAGADDAHLISRRARKHYTGMVIITQDPVSDLKLMGAQFITQKLIMPFEDEQLARAVVEMVGIRAEDYPDIEAHFIGEPDPADMADHNGWDGAAARPDRGDRQGFGFFVDEFRRRAPIYVAAEPEAGAHHAFDTTPGVAR